MEAPNLQPNLRCFTPDAFPASYRSPTFQALMKTPPICSLALRPPCWEVASWDLDGIWWLAFEEYMKAKDFCDFTNYFIQRLESRNKMNQMLVNHDSWPCHRLQLTTFFFLTGKPLTLSHSDFFGLTPGMEMERTAPEPILEFAAVKAEGLSSY